MHGAVRAAADSSPEFEARLRTFCPTWQEPEAGHGDELQELLRVAAWQCAELAERAQRLQRPPLEGRPPSA